MYALAAPFSVEGLTVKDTKLHGSVVERALR